MSEILLKKCYDKLGEYEGKLITYPEDLKQLELEHGSILDNINTSNSMGYKKYKEKLLKQKEYILKTPKNES